MKVDKGETGSPLVPSIKEDDMESNEAKNLIGQEVYWEAQKELADIVTYEKGWITIKTDDDKEHKVRAKDIVLMNSEDELVETEGGLETKEVDPSTISSGAASVQSSVEVGMDIECGCGAVFPAPKDDSFKCPECGAWHHVRLKPDMERYVKGLAATASGRDTVDINDEVASALRGMDLDSLYNYVCVELEKYEPAARFSKAMGAAFKSAGITCGAFLQIRYENLNPGMQRMNLGNLLRGAIKRQQAIDQRKMKNDVDAPEAK